MICFCFLWDICFATPARADDASLQDVAPRSTVGVETESTSMASELVFRALSFLGRPYRFGGSEPKRGFDCSGLVKFVFDDVLGVSMPRRAEQMSKLGRPVDRTALQPGDLLFYNTLARPFSHVAIYIGDGRQVHAPARGGVVSIEAVDDVFWRSRFNAARRIDGQTISTLSGSAMQARTATGVQASTDSVVLPPTAKTVEAATRGSSDVPTGRPMTLGPWPDEWSRGP